MSGVVPQDIFDSEESVLKALSVIRNSTLSTAEKSTLRDLFLDYAGEVSETRRNSLRTEIFNKLRPNTSALPTLSIPSESSNTEEVPPAEDTPTKTSPSLPRIGTGRPTPSFKLPSIEVSVSEVKSSIPEVAPDSEPAEVTPKEVIEIIPEPESPTPPEQITPIVAETSTPAPLNLRNRIDEIKHDINSKVGNPVNLINADEKIGREYMSALLDAMKSTNGGGGEASAAARLESAYQAALALIEKTPASNIPAQAENTSETKEEDAPEEIGKKIEIPDTPTTPEAPEETLNVPEPVAPVAEEVENEAEADENTVEPAKEPEPTKSYGLYHQPVDYTDEDAELSKKKEGEQNESKEKEVEKVNLNERHLKVGAPKVAATKNEDQQPLHSLRDEVALPEQMAKVKAEEVRREEAAKKPITDLQSPEVQSGLEQLLVEWKLFRSSGFLGTGPKGINHPLYKKLASLPMAAVVAGRFEGVTPEIKQSLTDYMNGWRYEQGIVHEMGETFESYLRRVIKQVLTRQRLSISS